MKSSMSLTPFGLVVLTLVVAVFLDSVDVASGFIHQQNSLMDAGNNYDVTCSARRSTGTARSTPATARTSLFYKNETHNQVSAPFVAPRLPQLLNEDSSSSCERISQIELRRNEIKKELARAAITNFDAKGKPNYAEDLMKELETMRPWERTAYHKELNARWSFVFTGVPTIGMRLITILSRISVGFPLVDFRDVYLEVMNDQSHVRAVVSWKTLGIPTELNVHTDLTPNLADTSGNCLLETFESLTLMGIPIPTPESWARTRTLDITYLDEDMMIARTAGGEPHLLLRNSRCTTADDECDIDEELTQFFDEAREKYGPRIARCLVDRDFGKDEADCAPSDNDDCEDCAKRDRRDPLTNILSFDLNTLFSPNPGGKVLGKGGDDTNLKP